MATIAAAVVVVASAVPALPQDRPLIWQASKVGDSAAGFTAGLRLRTMMPATVTASTTISGTGAGHVDLSSTPLTLNGQVTLTSPRAADWGREAKLGASYDVNGERGVLSLNEQREWLATERFSVKSRRTVQVVGVAGNGMGVSASQTVELDVERFSTQISTSAVYDSFSREIAGSIGIRRQIDSQFSVNLDIANPWEQSQPRLGARFDRKW